jgi:uncharacterized protein YqeY
MSLLDKIREDQLLARKTGAGAKALLLTTLIGEAAMIGKNNGNRPTTDEETIKVINKFIKNNAEFLSKITDEKKKLALNLEQEILNGYLPKQLTTEEMREHITSLKLTQPNLNLGSIMSFFKKNFAGLYDGRVLSTLAGEMLK